MGPSAHKHVHRTHPRTHTHTRARARARVRTHTHTHAHTRTHTHTQVTFLHIFHHSSITIVVGTILRFDYSGDMCVPVTIDVRNARNARNARTPIRPYVHTSIRPSLVRTVIIFTDARKLLHAFPINHTSNHTHTHTHTHIHPHTHPRTHPRAHSHTGFCRSC